MKLHALCMAVALSASALNAPALAQDASSEAAFTETFAGARLSFAAEPGLSGFTLTVTGPEGYYGEVVSARVAPSLRLADHGRVPDGVYTYQMTAATGETFEAASPMRPGANGRSASAMPRVGVSQTGSFRVKDGVIVETDRDISE